MLTPRVWWLAVTPVDLRCGADRLLVTVRQALGREPLDGSAYVFRNRAATRIKVLWVDAQGVWLAARRLHEGRFVWPHAGDAVWMLSPEQFAWLCAGVDWRRLSRRGAGLGRHV
ncbi:IS66 family insertion sequence element accessory protein TnpB [Vulcaniibacterium gelatinicum]|uniref:IS66 family insertion sequence element accessory protein TnpB n=1 Tax=Vulcaniibacterium gelatinicum TaxID=2598725 RepID=UPI0011CB0556|nr:IS66 family insertion sequence element accessory protein TnpB [Vulcaniibacterium gelatinicum]